ncbi:MAG: hypothetical protein HFI44_15630 [Lachnospiraceae bacterium]|nr:hypothetical protein [Lachnospiraceae bacterium]
MAKEEITPSEWQIMQVLWADYIYMASILIAAVCIFGKRMRLRRQAAGMEKVMFENVKMMQK